MPYTQTTWSSLQSSLQQRLDKPAQFYTNSGTYPEITLYLKEALRTWNCFANRYRDRLTFNTTSGVAWYNLQTVTPTNPATNFLARTVTDRDLVAEIQLHLLEPATPTAWSGTDMFTLADVVGNLQTTRDQFMVDTGVEQLRTVAPLAIPVTGRFDMPQDVIDIRRLEWVSVAGVRSHLWKTDEWASQSYNPGWQSAGPTDPPSTYSTILTHPLGVQLIPYPAVPGQIDSLTVNSGATLNPVTPVLMGIPDDWAWAVKYGAMATLLSQENQARDPERARYCEQRYNDGINLANLAPVIMRAQIDGVDVPVTSIHDLDSNNAGWPNLTPGTPTIVGISQYILAVSPPPNAGPHSITVDVLRPAPIPVLGTDFVTLGLEELDAILDYAHHIATFKEQGVEFKATTHQYEEFIRLAATYNDRLNANAFFREVLENRSQVEQVMRPRVDPLGESRG